MIKKSAFTIAGVWLLWVASVVLSFKAFSQPIAELNPIESISYESKHLPGEWSFNVTLPASYKTNPDKQFVVMLDLHPRSQSLLAGGGGQKLSKQRILHF